MGFVFSSNLFLLVPTDFSWAECGNNPAAHGTKVQPLFMVVLDGIKKAHTDSDVFLLDKTYSSILLITRNCACGSNHNIIFTKVDNVGNS
jgi:hypothetical protein